MESATVNNGNMYLSKGGTATDTMVASSGCMVISRIGSAARTEIQSGGHVFLYTEGAMTDITVRKGGVLSAVSDTSLPGVIDGLLMERHLAMVARRKSKNHLKGPAKRTREDDRRFAESFERLIGVCLAGETPPDEGSDP